jgi:hypothetical protein
MAWFEFKAKDGKGQIQAGNLEANSYQEAHAILHQRALQVVLLRSCSEPLKASALPESKVLPARSSPSVEAPNRWQPNFSLGWDVAGVSLLLVASLAFYSSSRPWGPVQPLAGKSRTLTVQGRLDYSGWKVPPRSVRLDIVLPDLPANFSTILELKGGVNSFSQRVDYISPASPTSAKIEITSARQKVLSKTVALTDSLEKVELGTCTLIYRKPAPRK